MREGAASRERALAVLREGWPHLAHGLALGDLQQVEGGTESLPRYRFGTPPARYVVSHGSLEAWVVPMAAMGAAYRAGLRVPRLVPAVHGSTAYVPRDEDGPDGGAWLVTTWLGGRTRADWGRLSDPALFRLGSELARLHRALIDLPPDLALWPEAADVLGRSAPAPNAVRRGAPGDQVLHGDPTPGNVLFSAGRAGQRPHDLGVPLRIGFVDFARTSRGAVEWDLARACVSLPPWARAYRRGEEPWRAARQLLQGYAAGSGGIDPERLREGFILAAHEGATWAETARLDPGARRRALRWAERVARTMEDGAAFPLP